MALFLGGGGLGGGTLDSHDNIIKNWYLTKLRSQQLGSLLVSAA